MSTTEVVSPEAVEAVKKLFQKSVQPEVKIVPVREERLDGRVGVKAIYYLAELRFSAKAGTHSGAKGIQRALYGTVAIGPTPDEAVMNLIPKIKRGLARLDDRRVRRRVG